MNSKNFEISLVNNKNLVYVYYWYVIPNVGDKIAISESKYFIVKERLLPANDSNRIVLFGDLL